MSISKLIGLKSDSKFVIPFTGKMFRSNIDKHNKALCFLINKGYIETDNLEAILYILDSITAVDNVTLVGSINKIKGKGNICYRQRIFFKSLIDMLKFCKLEGLRFELASDFRVTINSILNCVDELVYLERYAMHFSETIDEWLTNCCIVHLNYLLISLDMYSSLAKCSERILRDKKGYLDRSPFLVSSYDIREHKSGIFLECPLGDKRLYSVTPQNKDDMIYGYTTKNIELDKKAGVFK